MLHQPRFYLQCSVFQVARQIFKQYPVGLTPAGTGLSSPAITSDSNVPAVEIRGKEIGEGQRSRNMCRHEQLEAKHT